MIVICNLKINLNITVNLLTERVLSFGNTYEFVLYFGLQLIETVYIQVKLF